MSSESESRQARTTAEQRRQYMLTGELRAEIAYAVGGDPTRYGADSGRGLLKSEVVRVANRLQPADSNIEPARCELAELYKHVCGWAGGEYHANAGRPWGINRDNLKRIHAALDATSPREVANP